jgi:hypothetical protein
VEKQAARISYHRSTSTSRKSRRCTACAFIYTHRRSAERAIDIYIWRLATKHTLNKTRKPQRALFWLLDHLQRRHAFSIKAVESHTCEAFPTCTLTAPHIITAHTPMSMALSLSQIRSGSQSELGYILLALIFLLQCVRVCEFCARPGARA